MSLQYEPASEPRLISTNNAPQMMYPREKEMDAPQRHACRGRLPPPARAAPALGEPAPPLTAPLQRRELESPCVCVCVSLSLALSLSLSLCLSRARDLSLAGGAIARLKRDGETLRHRLINRGRDRGGERERGRKRGRERKIEKGRERWGKKGIERQR